MGSYPSVVQQDNSSNGSNRNRGFQYVQRGRYIKLMVPQRDCRNGTRHYNAPLIYVEQDSAVREWHDAQTSNPGSNHPREQTAMNLENLNRRNAFSPNDEIVGALRGQFPEESNDRSLDQSFSVDVDSHDDSNLDNPYESDDDWSRLNQDDLDQSQFPVHRITEDELLSQEPFPNHPFSPDTQARLRRRSAQRRVGLQSRRNLSQSSIIRRRIKRLVFRQLALAPVIEESCQPCTPRRGRMLFPPSSDDSKDRSRFVERFERYEEQQRTPDENGSDIDNSDDDHPFSPTTQATLTYESTIRGMQTPRRVCKPGLVHTQPYRQRDLTKAQLRSKRKKRYWSMQPGVSPINEQQRESQSPELNESPSQYSVSASPSREHEFTLNNPRRLSLSPVTPEPMTSTETPLESEETQPETPPQILSNDTPTRNAFINFSIPFHEEGRNAVNSVKEASEAWWELSQEERMHLSQEAGRVAKPYRSKNKHLNGLIKILDSMEGFNEKKLQKFRVSLDRWMNSGIDSCE